MSHNRKQGRSPTQSLDKRDGEYNLEELEQRMLFSADVADAFLADPSQANQPANEALVDENLELLASASATADTRAIELIFIDANTPDTDILVNDLLTRQDDNREFEIITLDAGRDGIQQISDVLGERQDVDAIHIISHGNDGQVVLGDTTLSQENIAAYSEQLQSWGLALDPDADILIYGCNLAASESGETLVDAISRLTGADVAASDDLTGSTALGGDWVLEYKVGEIETGEVFSDVARSSWGHLLVVEVDNTSTGTSATNNVTISHTTTGTDRLMLVGVSLNKGVGTAVSSISYNGDALELVGSSSNGDAVAEIWKLVNPDLGTHNVNIVLNGITDGNAAGVMTFTGVDLTDPLGTFGAGSGGSGGSGSATISSALGEKVFGIIAVDEAADYNLSPDTGQTEIPDGWDLYPGSGINGGGGTKEGAVSVDMSWTWPGDDSWAVAGVSIKPSSPSQTLWLSMDSNVGAPGADGLPGGWNEGQVLNFGGTSQQHGSDTDGDLSTVLDFDNFTLDATDPGALHFVSRDMTVGGVNGTFDLKAGDVLVSFLQDETILAAYSDTATDTLYGDQDLLVFRPTSFGNYSSGTFYLLLDEVVTDDLKGATLIEQDTTIGGTDVAAGSFLIIAENSATTSVDLFVPTGVGAGTTTGSITPFIDISDLGIDANRLRGIEVVEAATTIGGQALAKGDILVTLNVDDNVSGVAGNNLLVDQNDVFVLTLTSTGPATTAGTAAMFLDGSDVGLDDNPSSENPYALALHNYGQLTVDTTSDVSDGDTSSIEALILSKGADGKISLREAIEAANATPNGDIADVIHFDIGTGLQTIMVGAGGLPEILDSVVIDATTQPGYAGNPLVELDGSGATGSSAGLYIRTDDTTVKGFIIHSFPDEGIEIDGTLEPANFNVVQNNWVGIDSSGSAAGNVGEGILITDGAANNLIGGTGLNDGNVISGNLSDGIHIRENLIAGSNNNTIQGNLIGLNSAGTAAIGNGDEGISIQDNVTGTVIGGSTVAARNLISGNEGAGILIQNGATNTKVQGNYIGTDVAGSADLGNGKINGAGDGSGIRFWNAGTGNLIGGTGANEGNLIAFNDEHGVEVVGTSADVSILGNEFRSNVGLGIDLDGGTEDVNLVTDNDADDSDGGANNLQNYPLITTAALGGTELRLSGSLDTDGITTQYRIEFYGNVAGTQDATNGEGRFYLGETTVTTDGSGDALFTDVILSGVTLAAGDYVTATATEITDAGQVGTNDQLAYGDTSEFAVNFAITTAYVNFSVSSTSSISEDVPETATFTVVLSGDALVGANTASVDIVASGSAISGTDYDNFIAEIASAAGATTGVSFDGTDTLTFDSTFNGNTGLGNFVFTVDAIDDAAMEGTETIVATLSNPGNVGGNAGFGNTVSDSYTEASNTNITAHTPDSGLRWTKIFDNSSYEEAFIDASLDVIQGGFRASSENDTGQAYAAGPAPGSVDQTISFTLSTIETDSGTKPVGLFGRYADDNNYYYLRILPNANGQQSISLWKMETGTPQQLAQIDATIANGDTFKLEITDASKKVYHNNVEVLSSADNALTAAGKWGFFIGNFNGIGGHYRDTWQIDDFFAESGVGGSSTTTNITESDTNNAPTDLQVVTTEEGGTDINNDGGNDAYFVADDGGGLLGGLTKITVESTFSVTTPAADNTTLLSYADGTNDEELGLFLKNDGHIWFTAHSAGAPYQSTTGTYLQLFDGEKHQVSVSWDATNGAVDFYIDGALAESFTGYQTGQSITGGGVLVFGQDQDSELGGWNTIDTFSGTFYDVRIFDDVRTLGEVAAGYDQTLPPTEAGMIANWTFGDLSTGGVITDAVSGNNLTLQHASGTGFTQSTPELSLRVAEDAPDLTVVGSVAALDPDTGETFTYSLQNNAGGRFQITAGGEISVANSSLIDFEAASFHDITIRATDAGLLTYDEVFRVYVTNVNEAPTVNATASDTGTEDTDQVYTHAQMLTLIGAADVDDADAALTVAITNVVNGSIALSGGTGGAGTTFTFTPTANFVGNMTFDYQASDDDSPTPASSAVGTATVALSAVNDAPTVNATASDTGTEDTDQVYTHAQMLTLIGAADVDDANVSLTVAITNVVNGSVALSGGTGGAGTTFTFTPTGGFIGNMTFDYQVSDDEAPTPASSAVGTATVALSAVNDAPSVNATASDTGTEDTDQVYTHAQMLTLIGAADVDDADAALTVAITNVVNGSVALSGGTGGAGTTFTFTPTGDFVGNMTFDYQVSDDEAPTPASSAVGTATVALSAVNDAPTVNATASDTGTEDTDQVYTHAQMLTLIGTADVDDVDANLSIAITNVINGSVALSGGTGGAGTTFTFTPTGGFVGNMTFDYQVSDDEAPTPATSAVGTATLALAADNDAPTINATASDTGTEDTDQVYTHAQILTLIGAADVDDADASLTVAITNVVNGSVVLSGGTGGLGTTFTFTPTGNFVGNMTFDYQVSDDEAPTPASSAVGTATVALAAANDAPTVNATASDTGTEDTDQVYTHAQMLTLIGAADVDDANAALSVAITNVINGSVVLSGGTGGAGTTFTFTPTGDFVGNMTFDYQVSDDDSPTPATSAVGTATVALSAVNDAPTVNATASDTGTEDTDQVYTHAQMLTLIGAADVDDADAALTVAITNVVNGSVALSGGTGGAGTTFTFTPTANFVGNMTFDYQVSDDEAPTPASSAVGTATVALSAENDAPTVNATASDTGTEDTDQVYTHAQMLTLIGAADVDDADAALTVAITNVVNGSIALSGGTGGAGTTFTFTPTANFVGNMTFDYQVSDDEAPTPATSAVGTATLALAADNDAPTINATASDTGTEDTDQVYTHAQILTLIGAADVDDADANLSIAITNVVNGSIALSGGTGGAGTTFTFTPTANFVGNMTFDYQVSDDEAPTPATSAVGTATVALAADNDAPTVTATASDTGTEDTDQVYTHAQMLTLIGASDVDDADANLSIAITNVVNGSVALSGGTGGAGTTFTFTPTANFVGNMTFDYQVSDDDSPTPATSAVGTATVALSAVNDAPTVNATASDTGNEDTDQVYTHAQMLTLIGAADVDDADATLTVAITNVVNGSIALSGGTGDVGTTFTFTPTANFVGNMTFDYQVSDDDSPTPASSAVGTATVALSAVNDAPTINATASDTGTEDTDQVYTHAQMLTLIGAADVDDADANLSVAITNVVNGSIALTGGTGGVGTTFTFTPTANFFGNMTFDYQVSDDHAPTPASSAVGTATVALAADNDAPTVNATASDTGTEDTDQVYTHAQMLSLIGAADVDDADAALTVAITNVVNGTVALSGGTGGAGTTFTFTPTGDFVGNMTFDYQVSDDEAPTPASSAVGTATVALSAVNDAPTVNATASDTGTEDTDQVYTHAQMLTLIGAADVDDADASLSIAITNVVNGSVVLTGGTGGAGTIFTFTPTLNFVGDMTFDYQVSDDDSPTPATSAVGTATVALAAANDAPTVNATASDTGTEDTDQVYTHAQMLTLIGAADVDDADANLSIAITNVVNGSVVLTGGTGGAGTTFTFTPTGGFVGNLTFDYQVSDDELPTPATSAVGTATVALSAVNDAPTVNATASDTGTEDTDQVYTHAQMLTLIGAADVDDADAALTVAISNVVNGTVALSGGTGGAGTTFTFTPTGNFVGNMTFDYQVSDDEAPTPASSAVGTATVALAAENDAPTVNATASDTGTEDTDQVYTHAQMLTLIGASDVDDADAALTVAITNVVNGSIALSGGTGGAGTTFTFTPTTNFVGNMTFDYQVSDDEAPTPASSAVGTATVALSAVNDAPTVNATASDTGTEDTDQVYTHAQMLTLIGASDVDDADAALTVAITNIVNGSVALSGGTGGVGTTFTFTPTANFVGNMTFDYQVSDDEAPTPASSAVGTATVALAADNDEPTVNATASDTGTEDTDQIYTHAQMLTLIGASDVDDVDAALTVAISNVVNGTVALSGGTGGAGTTFTFTPTTNFVGNMTFDYQVSDDEAPTPASSAVGTATVALSGENDTPTVNATASDTGTEDIDQVYTHAQMLTLIGASDVDDADAALTVAITNVVNGSVALSGGTGGVGTTFTFTPTANFVGNMTFDYQASDDEAPTPASSAVGTATVALSAVNDAPTVNATASDTGTEDTDQVYTHVQMLSLIGAADVDDADAALSVAITNVSNGSVLLTGGTGGAGTTFTFTPTGDFVGNMTFDYQVSDDDAPTPASSAVGTATVALSAVNDAPTVSATASDTGTEDTDQVYTHAQMLTLIGASDVDDADAALTVAITNVVNGSIALSGGTGGVGTTFTFTPTTNFVGNMTFDYQVSDDEAPTPASSAVGTATVALSAVNDAPTVNATASDTGTEDTDQVYTHAQMLTLIGASDVDDADAALTVAITNVVNGSIALSGGTGGVGTTFTFTPTTNFVGNMTFDYQVSDDDSPTPATSAVGTATVALSAVNDAPTVNATASDTGTEDTDQVYTHAQMLSLIGAADVDDVDANLSIAITNVVNGSVVLTGGTGGAGTTFTFTPTGGFTGNMTFDYQVSDDEAPTPASSAVGTATVALSAVNDAPTVNATASDTGTEDTDQVYTHAQMLTLIGAADVDDADASLSIAITNVINGSVALSGGTGGAGTTFTFTPTTNFVGNMTFDYQVSDDDAPTPASSAVGTATVALSAVNDAPTVNATASDTGNEDTDQVYTHAQMLTLIGAADVDDADATLTVAITNVVNGSIALSGGTGGAGTTFTFTPTGGFTGNMTFDYQVSDDDSPTPATSAVGTATVALSAVNDAPTVNATASDTGTEDTDQVYTHAQMLTLIGAADVDDADANLSIAITNVLNGSVALSGGTGGAGTTFTFTPTGNFVGNMTFDYQVSDDDAPTPATSTVGTATVALSAVNDAPTVNATASDTGTEDTDQVYTHAQMLSLIGAADVDDVDANLSIAITNVVNGSVVLTGGTGGAGTTFTFTPTGGFTGNMTFDYQVSDDEAPTPASSAVGTATVALSAVNDAPTVNATASDTGTEDTDQVYTHAQMLTLIGASDVDDVDANLSIAITNVINGSVALSGGTGGAGTTFTFTPTGGFVGNMTFDYQVSDDDSPTPATSAVGTATVALSAVNDAPTVNATASDTGTEDTDQVYTHAQMLTLIGAADVDDADASLSIAITNVINGSVALSGGTGGVGTTFTFTPTGDFVGNMTFDYQVSDDEAPTPATSSVGTATVALSAVNDAPTVNATASDTGTEDTDQVYTHAQMLTLIGAADVDDADATLTVAITNVVNGSVVLTGGTGGAGTTFTFTPTGGFTGNMTFDYQVSDDEAPTPASSAVGTATVALSAVNDAPTVNATASDTGTEDTDQVYTHAQMLTLIGAADVDDSDAALTVAITNVVNGSVALSGGTGGAGTTFTFTPTGNFVGNMTFDYQVSDDEAPTPASSAVGTATVALSAVNDAPTVNATASDTGNEDTDQVYTHAQMLTLIGAADVDDADATLTVAITNVVNGSIALSGGTGGAGTTFTFTPTGGFTGNMTFDYQVSDNEAPTPASSAVGTATVALSAVNDAPTVNATASDTGTEDTDQVYTHAQMLILIGAADVDDANAALSAAITNVINGSVVLTGGTGGTGTTFTFTPTGNFVGNMTFDYQVSDDHAPTPASSAVGTATVALSAVNDAPTVNATASDTGTEDTDQVYTHAQMLSLIGAADVDDVDANLSIAITNVVNGSVVLTGGTGGAGTTFTFTPTGGFTGNMTFDYQVSDNEAPTPASSAVGTATVALSAVNDAPTVNATASDTGTEDTDQVYTHAQMLTLIGAADVDDVDAALTVAITNVSNGSITLSGGTGGSGTTFTLTPTANFFGNMTFDYQVSDDAAPTPATSSVGSATVALSAVNDAPTVNATASDTGTEDTDQVYTHAQMLTLIGAADVDDGDAALTVAITNVVNGSIALSGGTGGASTTFIFTPTANFIGNMTFDYQVSDDEAPTPASSAVGTATVALSAVNDAPTVESTIADQSLPEDFTSYTIDLNAAFDDVETADSSLVYGVSGNTNINVSIASGIATITTTADWNGSETLTFTATDSGGLSASQTVVFAVSAVADIADDNGVSVVEDTATVIAVLTNDSFENTPTITATSLPANGAVVINGDNTLTYTPDSNYTGADSFTYTVTSGGVTETATVNLTVTPVNDTPTIGGADTGAVTEDVDPDADTLLETAGTMTIVDPDTGESTFIAETIFGNYGSLTIDATGAWSYSADNTQTAIQQLDVLETLTDTLTVTTADGSTHNVIITINGAEDAPVVGGTNTGTVAEDGSLTASGILSITDVDASDNPVSFNDETATAGDNDFGTFEITGNNWTYTLDNANTAIQALDAGDTLTDTHTFAASDGSVQVVTVTIHGTNDIPVAINDSGVDFTTNEDTPFTTGDTLANDTLGSAPTTISSFDAVSANGGSVSYNDDGTFSYTPAINFNGSDSFTYTLTDSDGDTSTATVIIAINAVNDAPEAINDSYTLLQNSSLEVTAASVLANDSDVDGDSLTATLVDGTANGTLILNSDGTFSYVPDRGFVGDDSFTYLANDGVADAQLVTVLLQVAAADEDTTIVEDEDPFLPPQDEDTNTDPVDTTETEPPVEDATEITPENLVARDSGWEDATLDEVIDEIVLLDEDAVAELLEETLFDPVGDSVVEVARTDPLRISDRTPRVPFDPTANLKFGGTYEYDEILNDHALWKEVKSMQTAMDESFGDGSEQGDMFVKVSAGTSLTLTAGFVSYLLRAGTLLSSMLSFMPVWKGVDPLAVLVTKPKEKEDKKKHHADNPENEQGEEDRQDDVDHLFNKGSG